MFTSSNIAVSWAETVSLLVPTVVLVTVVFVTVDKFMCFRATGGRAGDLISAGGSVVEAVFTCFLLLLSVLLLLLFLVLLVVLD